LLAENEPAYSFTEIMITPTTTPPLSERELVISRIINEKIKGRFYECEHRIAKYLAVNASSRNPIAPQAVEKLFGAH
jgi:hypothetical protein